MKFGNSAKGNPRRTAHLTPKTGMKKAPPPWGGAFYSVLGVDIFGSGCYDNNEGTPMTVAPLTVKRDNRWFEAGGYFFFALFLVDADEQRYKRNDDHNESE